jgi:hypothetical protein
LGFAAILALVAAFSVCVATAGCSAGSSGYNGSTSSTSSSSQSSVNTTTYVPNYANIATQGIWGKSTIAVYFAASDATNVLSPSQVATYTASVLAGFNEWTSQLGNKFTYTQATSSAAADVVVTFTGNSAAVGDTASWATSKSYTNGVLTSVALTMTATPQAINDASSDMTTASNLLLAMGAQAFASITGLPTSNVSTDITYPTMGITPTVLTPSTRDINTFKSLYISYF